MSKSNALTVAWLRGRSYVFSMGLLAFFILSICGFLTVRADADVRQYYWVATPNPDHQTLKDNADYLADAAKSDLTRYSDSDLARLVEECSDTDAAILRQYTSYNMKELNSLRGSIIESQRTFLREVRRRQGGDDSQ